MKRLVLAVAAATSVVGCLPDNSPQMIVVDGEGTAQMSPDQFSLSVGLTSEIAGQKEAVRQIASKLRDLEAKFPQLEGMTKLSIVTNSAGIEPAYESSCAERARYGSDGSCPIVGHFGKASLIITASPPEAAGPALALLSELAVTEVSFQGFSLSDDAALKAAADDAAMKDASSRAVRLAQAAGGSIGPILRVQFGDGLRDHRDYDPYRDRATARTSYAAQDVLAPKISPEIELNLSPQPIEHESMVTVGYALEGPSAR